MRRPEDRARNTGDPEPSEHPTITARNLSCGYHRHAILTGVDLEVSTGEVLCLLGPTALEDDPLPDPARPLVTCGGAGRDRWS